MKKTGFALIAVLGLCRCYPPPPDFDLREPVYLVLGDDFTADDAEKVRKGAGLWYKHWETMEDKLVIKVALSNDEVTGSNPPIKVVFDSGIKNDGRQAQYQWEQSGIKIAFRTRQSLVPYLVAHEIGHALWTVGHIDDRASVLNKNRDPCGDGKKSLGWFPLPQDVLDLCEANPEITCPNVVWCEGTFYYEGACPSSSPEEIDQRICLRRQENENETETSALKCGTSFDDNDT